MNSLTTLLTDIAQRHLFIETLVTRNSDSLDFHNVSVWGVEAALREAYRQGAKASADLHFNKANGAASVASLNGGYTMTTTAEVEQKLKDLTTKLNAYCDANGLPHESAGDLAHRDDITDEQRRWLNAFIEEWDGVADYYTVRT